MTIQRTIPAVFGKDTCRDVLFDAFSWAIQGRESGREAVFENIMSKF